MYCYEYPRAALTVDAIVTVNGKSGEVLLLIRRGREPFAGMWALPGGFAGMDETLEEACIRELQEETGIRVAHMQQFKTYDAIGRDPRHRTISVVYSALLGKKIPVAGSDDAAEACWFPIGSLPHLAFDHSRIIADFLESRKLI